MYNTGKTLLMLGLGSSIVVLEHQVGADAAEIKTVTSASPAMVSPASAVQTARSQVLRTSQGSVEPSVAPTVGAEAQSADSALSVEKAKMNAKSTGQLSSQLTKVAQNSAQSAAQPATESQAAIIEPTTAKAKTASPQAQTSAGTKPEATVAESSVTGTSKVAIDRQTVQVPEKRVVPEPQPNVDLIYHGLVAQFDKQTGRLTLHGGEPKRSDTTEMLSGADFDLSQVRDVVVDGMVKVADDYGRGLFENLTNMRTLSGLDKVDVRTAVNFDGMFKNDQAITELDLSHWDMRQARSATSMFENTRSLRKMTFAFKSPDLRTVDRMFFNMDADVTVADSAVTVKNWDAYGIQAYDQLFRGAHLLSADLANFDFSGGTKATGVFQDVSLQRLDLSNSRLSR
ncbi:BspA family leucine-rich repeat surface protein [Lactiplantibacillus plajomi]